MKDTAPDARSSVVLVHTWDMAGRAGRKEKKRDGWDSPMKDVASRPGGTLGTPPVRRAR